MVLVGVATSAATAQADPQPPGPPPAPKTTIDADGTYAIGKDIQPGTYSSAGPVGGGACYWKRVSGSDIVDNALSNQFTVIEVAGLDRPGLLFELTNTLSDLNLDITSAHITTFGEKAVDVFYVTDLTNKKITSPQRHNAIRARLLAVLGGDADVRAFGSDVMTRT